MKKIAKKDTAAKGETASKKETAPPKAKPVVRTNGQVQVLVFCPSDLILAGILKALEPDAAIEVLNIEKNTIDIFMDSIRKLRPEVVLFASIEPLPNIREICKAIRELAKGQKTQLLLLGNIPSHEEVVGLINSGARGYFDLNDPLSQLTEAIRIVQKGEIGCPATRCRASWTESSPSSAAT